MTNKQTNKKLTPRRWYDGSPPATAGGHEKAGGQPCRQQSENSQLDMPRPGDGAVATTGKRAFFSESVAFHSIMSSDDTRKRLGGNKVSRNHLQKYFNVAHIEGGVKRKSSNGSSPGATWGVFRSP